MLYFVNPAGKKRRASKKKPSAAQLRARRKFAQMAKARAKSAKKSTKRAGKKGKVMAKRKGTAKRRRRSTAKRRSAVTSLRRHSVYITNPRRKRRRTASVHRRRARYRRNPGVRSILGTVKQTAIDTALVLGGGAVGRVVGGLLPAMKNPYAEAAKGTLVAVGVRMLGKRFLGDDKARFAAAGAMQPVLKNLILSFSPTAASYLGDYETMGSYGLGDPYGNGGYLGDGGISTQDGVDTMGEEVGAYDIY